MPKVSVIIPVYNVEKYLRECLDSVVNQTLKDIEIICVDDGSTDNSIEILKEYAQKDNRFIILEQENQGSAVARNKGLETAGGTFIAFMDSDDFYPNENILERLYNLAIEKDVKICGGSVAKLKPDGTYMLAADMEKEYTFESDGYIEYIDYQFDYGFTRFIYNRKFLEEYNIKFPDYIRQEDPPFFIRAMSLAEKFYAIKEPSYIYRVSYKTVKWTERKVIDTFRGINDCLNQCKENGLYQLYCTIYKRINTGNWFSKAVSDVIWSDKVRKQVIKTFTNINKDILSKHGINTNLHEVYQSIIDCPKYIAISVIVPVYNVEKYLPKCLDSLINQTFKNLEIICVNDGSTDGSLEILENYANKDKRIKIISQENQGLPNARNTGLKEATGDYFTFLDSDDWLDLNWIEKMYNAIISNDAEMAKSGYKHYLGKSINDDDINDVINIATNRNTLLKMNDNNITVWATLYKTDFLKKENILFFDKDILKHEDILYTLKATYYANKIVPVSNTYYNYRRDTSILSSFNYSECKIIPTIHQRAITFLNNISINKRDYITATKRIIWRTFDTFEKLNEFPEFLNDKFTFLKKIIKFLSQIKYKEETFADYKKELIGLNKKYINKYLQRNKANILIVEYNNCHGECLPGYVNYFLELGYKVDVIISNKLAQENPLNMFLDNANVYIDILNENEIIALLNSDRINEYKYCFLNSEIVYSKNKVIFDLIKVTNNKPKFLCVCHRFENLKKLDKVSQPIILKSFKKYHNKYTVNPHYFRNIEKHSKNDLINFVVAGNIEKKRKNYDLLINTVERLLKDDITNFKITVIGKGDDLYLPEHIKSFFDIKGRLTYSNMYEELLNADFFLTLLDPNNAEHSRYKTLGTSGSFQLINGFLIPAIIEQSFAKVHDYNTENAIVYENNDNLYDAMKYAISLEKTSYLKLQENLEFLSEKIHNQSLINLQKMLKYFSLKRYIYLNLENIFSITNEGVRKVITIFGIKFKFKSKKLVKRQEEKKKNEKFDKILKSVQAQNKSIKKLQEQISQSSILISQQQEQISQASVLLSQQNQKLSQQEQKLEQQDNIIKNTLNDKLKNLLSCQNDKILKLNHQFNNAIKSFSPQTNLRSIVYHLADHCNLKCQCCDHFAPLAKEKLADIKDFEKDIKRLSELTKTQLEIIKLMGGEPLLHPEIKDFMRISRMYFPSTRIEIVTNGILLNTQKEDFWSACKEFDITIVPTKYPLNIDYDRAKQTAKEYEVKYEYYSKDESVIKTSYHIPLDLTGQQNAAYSFAKCFHANWCVMLKNGKLYTCTVAPNIEHFNKYFNKNIPLTDRDGIDIYKAQTIEEILDFLSKPIPFCKYCNVNGRTFEHEWGRSKKEIEEWT